jgi:hypothetical protein
MFNQIPMWQMVVDLSLVTSILIMAFKAMKSSRTSAMIPQVVELENRILKLIAEAEGSAKHINDQLLRREQNIHKYVNELEKSEKEISLSVVESESLTKELGLLCESARREVSELKDAISELETQRTTRAAATMEARRSNASAAPRRSAEFDEEFTEESESEAQATFSTRTSSRRAADWMDAPEPPRMERESTPSRASSGLTLQDLYNTAENMLKNGQKPQDVSRRTKLPFDRVERLAQMIEIEREEKAEKRRVSATEVARDPRLGALGVGRRAGSTL